MADTSRSRSQSLPSDDLTVNLLSRPTEDGHRTATCSPSVWLPKRARRWLPFAAVVCAVLLLLLQFGVPSSKSLYLERLKHLSTPTSPPPPFPTSDHAVQTQTERKPETVEQLYARQSRSLDEAVSRYTLRNGRRPPAHYDKWYQHAVENKCLIDDYDQIRRDFEPFYRLADEDPERFQLMIDLGRILMMDDPKGMVTIRIEDGAVKLPSYTGSVFDSEWSDTLSRFSHILPDMDFLINGRDEPRVVFNVHEPTVWKDALALKDNIPFHNSPIPTSEFFKHRSGCSSFKDGSGTTVNALEDVAFIRSASSAEFTTDLWPMLSMTKISTCFSDIMFPGQYYYESSAWSGKFSHPNDVPWEDKKDQIYWRGASNGGHIYGDNYRQFSRFRLVKIAQNDSDLVDAKITGWYASHCTNDCERDPIIEEYNIGGAGSPREDVYNYKYLLDVDGNTFSGRYLGLLRSGSLVFKATAFAEYFNDWLRPYEHYVPVKIDLSDLVEKVRWAIEHPVEARRIQEAGMEVAGRVITDRQNDCYFGAVLLEWARLQGYARVGVPAEGERGAADF
ncbi:glycosyl transferase family 90-domain-containing protein [Roridomyces roridus]|uniref:Glycosyl transferase family 90-domain-containing protein n=1 Tax=Roridomyces roridus TaxID=1738132 RepID=A0AAD7FCA5_9AGAR|nr:glycosyl transferase family 90-domain-containing protein [Roridomyces roridus]